MDFNCVLMEQKWRNARVFRRQLQLKSDQLIARLQLFCQYITVWSVGHTSYLLHEWNRAEAHVR
jgi:hypothetical protein